jgi:hypothetical protein
MGGHRRRIVFYFQCSIGFTSGQESGRREVIAAGINCLLTILVTGNNSESALLTTFGLTTGAANELFTKTRGISAFRDGNGQIEESLLKASCVRANVTVARNASANAGAAT